MKFLIILSIVALFMALSIKAKTIEEVAEVQLKQSEVLHDSAMVILKELHEHNDSLLTKHFGE